MKHSVTQQAKEVVHYVQEVLTSQDLASNLPLIIVGYRQGGLVACCMGNAHSSRLAIKGIATIAAPLMGVPARARTPMDIRKLILDGRQGLDEIITDNPSANNARSDMYVTLLKLTIARKCPFHIRPGIMDILPKSKCLGKVHHFLRGPQAPANLPCLLIAAYHNKLSQLFPNVDDKLA